jgi:hypothetical protein
MMTFWLWVGAGCVACALAGFSAIRVGGRLLSLLDGISEAPVRKRPARQEPIIPVRPRPPVAVWSAPDVRARPARPAPSSTKVAPAQAATRPAPVAPGRVLSRQGGTGEGPVQERLMPRESHTPVAVWSAPDVRARPTRRAPPSTKVAPARTATPPAPTAPQPQAEKLALWARQIEAGQRKMSIATDGCRVTWNRTCKHGHPTWLVHLGYVTPRAGPTS